MPVAGSRQALSLKAKLFRGLSDPSRLGILEALRDGPRTVTEIVAATGLSQSNASSHLACLHECGLVAREPHGRFVHYRLVDEHADELLRTADALLREVARGINECVNYNVPAASPGGVERTDRRPSRPGRRRS